MKEAFTELVFYGLAIALGWFACMYHAQMFTPAPIELTPQVGLGKTFVIGTSTVKWVTDPVKIQEAFIKADEKHHAPEGLIRTGLAVYNSKECTIYAYEPSDVNDRERMYVLGHELLHCFRGDYHK